MDENNLTQDQQNLPKSDSVSPQETTSKLETTDVPEANKIDQSNNLSHNSKNSNHIGMILGIIAVVIILGIIGVAVWFFGFYSNPDKVAYDAVENLLIAPNVITSGSVVIETDIDDSPLKRLSFELENSSRTLPSSSTARLLLEFTNDMDIDLQVSTVFMRDGVIYIQFSDLVESIEKLKLDQDTKDALSLYLDTIEVINNEWWQISIPDIIDSLELESMQSNSIKEVYSCAVEAMDSDISGEMARFYGANKFLQIEQVNKDAISNYQGSSWDNNLYQISINKQKYADFVNQIPETDTVQDFFDCYNDVMRKYGGDDAEQIDLSDIDEISADDVEWSEDFILYAEISRFNHRLNRIFGEKTEDQIKMSVSLALDYQEVEVSAPSSYRPLTDLIDEITEIIYSGKGNLEIEDGLGVIEVEV